MGLVSPLGSELETLWGNLTQGNSGIRPLESLPTASLPFQSGGEVKDFTGSIDDYGPLDKQLGRAIKKNMKVMCREIEMGVAAAQKALLHSGLGAERQPQRCGCLFGSDYILTRPEEFEDGVRQCRAHAAGQFDVSDWPQQGLPKVNPLWLLKYLPNMPNSHVSIYNDFRGPSNSLTVREASMNLSLAESASIIQRGAADVMLVGATGTRIHPLRTAHVALMETLASERSDPREMSRPFDRSSDGMVVGEGAGALMLESYEHARARGAKIWGEIIGSGAAMVGPAVDGGRDYLRQAVHLSLKSALAGAAERLPSRWHLHAHGLSTPQADSSEGLAIGDVLADFPQIPVTAAKSYFGNLGAGSGAVELICSLLALEHGQLFPIRNLQNPASYAPWPTAEAGADSGRAVVHSSFTLQGQASAIVIAALED
ncbi:MAG: beta-ketoacyl-[acyl-carrier-protein] synthase family protein [Planctomycetales bacterium]|nr:beta-ketoacyl-[acyl-carrier-protein] synthase family protein [Planctomycetales bacterium]